MEYIIFVALAFAASMISAVFGFGTALVLLAIGAHILPVQETIALASVSFAASTITKSFLFARHIDWKVAAIMAFASLPFAYFGASLVAEAPGDLIRRLMGGMILIYVALTSFDLLPKFRIATPGLIAGSSLYGFISGLLGSGNVVKVILFREMNFSKHAFVGAMAATSVLSNAAKLIAYTRSDLLNPSHLWPAAALIAAAIIAAFTGRRLLEHFSQDHFELGLKILLVEESEDNRRDMQNSQEGLKELRKNTPKPYQLLLINSRLPTIGGFRFLNQVLTDIDLHIPTVIPQSTS